MPRSIIFSKSGAGDRSDEATFIDLLLGWWLEGFSPSGVPRPNAGLKPGTTTCIPLH